MDKTSLQGTSQFAHDRASDQSINMMCLLLLSSVWIAQMIIDSGSALRQETNTGKCLWNKLRQKAICFNNFLIISVTQTKWLL
jgi:hypothetical protein